MRLHVPTFTLINSEGCDSIITLNLVINNLPNNSITANNDGSLSTISSSSYQWIDCSSNLIIPGEVSQTFYPLTNGVYASIVTDMLGCIDTSNCFVVNNLSLLAENFLAVNLFPNPTSKNISISFESSSLAKIQVLDALGKVIQLHSLYNNEHVNIENLESGVYFFHVDIEGQKTLWKVIKE